MEKEIDLEGIATRHMEIGLFSDFERSQAISAMREAVELALDEYKTELYRTGAVDFVKSKNALSAIKYRIK